MAVTIKADFNMAAIQKEIEQAVQKYKLEVIQAYRDAATVWMERARAKTKIQGGFGNITFNLRSSIGFLLLDDGREIAIEFETVGPGEAGAATGMAYARELAGSYTDGIALICVAGEDYAAAVESRGYDVITGSSLYIEQDLADLLEG